MSDQIIVLGTGGTIAGTAASSANQTGYTAAQIGVETLLQSVPGLQEALAGSELRSEQVAQLDSKDMDFETMRQLAQRCAFHLVQPQVKAVVITHGTDTLEETAYFLHRVIPTKLQTKPIVMTCAMRPATSSEADGPGNLRDAALVARDPHARGVLVVCAGLVHHALTVQKVHSYALNAFSSGDCALGEMGAAAQVVNAQVSWHADFEQFLKEKKPLAPIKYAQSAMDLIVSLASNQAIAWPRVEIVLNHAQASGAVVRALLAEPQDAEPLRGLIVAGTGNGTVSQALQKALDTAQERGVEVMVTSRCAWGGVRDNAQQITALSPAKARIDLMLRLLEAQAQSAAADAAAPKR